MIQLLCISMFCCIYGIRALFHHIETIDIFINIIYLIYMNYIYTFALKKQ